MTADNKKSSYRTIMSSDGHPMFIYDDVEKDPDIEKVKKSSIKSANRRMKSESSLSDAKRKQIKQEEEENAFFNYAKANEQKARIYQDSLPSIRKAVIKIDNERRSSSQISYASSPVISVPRNIVSNVMKGIGNFIGQTKIGKAAKKFYDEVVKKAAKAIGKAVDGIVTGLLSETGPIGKAIGWIAGKLAELAVKLASRLGKDAKDLGAGLVLIGGQVISFVGTAIIVLATAFVSAVTLPLIIVFIGLPLSVVLVLFIINQSAWVVPPGGPSAINNNVSEDCLGTQADPATKPAASGIVQRGNYAFPMAETNRLSYDCYHHDGNKSVDVGIIGNPGDAHIPLLAYTSGQIYLVQSTAKGGNGVWMKGDDGRTYYYAHSCNVYVKPGDRVSAGEVIATSDNTGKSTAEHLHFAIMASGSLNFPGGDGDVCPQTVFENELGMGRCPNISTNCVRL